MAGFGFAIAFCVVAGIAAVLWFKFRTGRLARSRRRMTVSEFVEYFSASGISPIVATVVYDHLSNLPWMRNFPIQPADSLAEIYRLTGQELIDACVAVAARAGRGISVSQSKESIGLETVEDLTRFVASLPSKTSVPS